MVTFNDEKEEKELAELRELEEEELIQSLAERDSIPYINLVLIPVENDALRLLNEAEARAGKLAAFAINGKKVSVAVFTVNTQAVQDALKKLEEKGYQLDLHMA